MKPKKSKPKINPVYARLSKLIAEYVDAAIAESWKGGGDPAEIEVLEARMNIARLELNVHMEKMQREQQ
jgi:hypothetical protein